MEEIDLIMEEIVAVDSDDEKIDLVAEEKDKE